MIKLQNKRIVALLNDKEKLIEDGRTISWNIEKVEKKIAKLEEQEKKITGAIEPAELIAKGNEIDKKIDILTKELEAVAQEIYTMKYNAIPKEIREQHQEWIKMKSALETDRNKVALNVQKIKDKVIPMIRKEVKPLLKEFEDMETANVKGNEILIRTFNHLEDWKKAFKAKQ